MSLKTRLSKLENELKAQNVPCWQRETENLVRAGKVTLDDVIDEFGTDSFNIWPNWFVLVSDADRARAKEADERNEIKTLEFEQQVIEHLGGIEKYNALTDKLANHEITSEQWRDAIKFW